MLGLKLIHSSEGGPGLIIGTTYLTPRCNYAINNAMITLQRGRRNIKALLPVLCGLCEYGWLGIFVSTELSQGLT